MKFRFIESDNYEIIAYGKNKTDLIKQIETLCSNDDISLIGYSENQIKELNPAQIECFYTEGDKIYGLFNGTKYNIKKRLYELNNLLNTTFIYVTHDQVEAMTMANKIVVMNKGFVQQVGSPIDVYDNPNNLFVATFIGSPAMNILDATYDDGIITLFNDFKIKKPEALSMLMFYATYCIYIFIFS